MAVSLPTLDPTNRDFPRHQTDGVHVVSVRDFGAVGDGRVDDSGALYRAWEATRAAGAAVYLPPGRYRCSRALRTSTPCRMFGAGEQSQLVFDQDIPPSHPFRTLCIEAPENPRPGEDFCQLSDFSFDGQSDGPRGRSDALMAGLGLIRATGIVDRVLVRETWGIGIVFHACHDLTIRGCRVTRSGRDGISGFWGNRRIWILDNVVDHPGDDGIAMNAADQILGQTLAQDVHIVGNHISNGEHFGRGIYLAGVACAWVAQNTINSVVSSGIAVQPNALTGARSEDIEIMSNHVSHAGALPTTRQPLEAIRIEAADRVRVANNALAFSGGQGIFVHNAAEVSLRANLVTDCGRATPAAALDCRNVQGLSVVANECSRSSGPGILIESATRARVLANDVEDTTAAVLLVRGSLDDVIVSENVLAAPSRPVRDAVVAAESTVGSVLFANNLMIVSQGTERDLPASFRTMGNQAFAHAH